MYVRVYCSQEESTGRDDGGYYKMEQRPDPPSKLQKRMSRCYGCHDDFYNNRANFGDCTHCWSLDDDENFKGQGKPGCYH